MADTGYKETEEDSDNPDRSGKSDQIKFTATRWVKEKLDHLANQPGPWPDSHHKVAEQLVREALGRMFAEEWTPRVFPFQRRTIGDADPGGANIGEEPKR